jgi:5'-nucleotidase
MKGDMILNINTPDVPSDEIKGVKFTRMGRREYDEFFEETVDENGNVKHRYGGERVIYDGLPDDIDVIAHQKGYATITPLHFDMTAHHYINEIKNWGI